MPSMQLPAQTDESASTWDTRVASATKACRCPQLLTLRSPDRGSPRAWALRHRFQRMRRIRPWLPARVPVAAYGFGACLWLECIPVWRPL